jgi:hypothetical protein
VYHPVCPKWFLCLRYAWRKLCIYLALTLTLSSNGPKRDSTWPSDLGVRSDASKTISEAVVCSAQTVHLSRINISTISNKLTQVSTWASSPRITIRCIQNNFWAYGMFSTNHAPILHWHHHYLQMVQNEILHDPHHLGVPLGASKMISEPLVHSAQTMHLSCVKISTISNKLNQASTWSSSTRSTIRCVRNDFRAYGMFRTNHAPTSNRQQHYLQMDQIVIPHDPRHLGLPSGACKMIFWACGTFSANRALSYVKISTISKWTESSIHLSLIT